LRGVSDRLRQSRRDGYVEAAVPAVRQAIHPIAYIEPRELAFGACNAGQDAGTDRIRKLKKEDGAEAPALVMVPMPMLMVRAL